jgi:nucleoside-diphosphate-sugar epimerase
MRILLTGGAGFIGSHVAERLASRHAEYTVRAGDVDLDLACAISSRCAERLTANDPSRSTDCHPGQARLLLELEKS